MSEAYFGFKPSGFVDDGKTYYATTEWGFIVLRALLAVFNTVDEYIAQAVDSLEHATEEVSLFTFPCPESIKQKFSHRN